MYELGYRLRYFLSNSPLVNAKHAKAGSEQQAAGRREVWFLVEVNRALPGDCLLCMREAWGIGYGLAMSEGQEEICNLQTGFQEIRQYFAPLLPRSKLFLFFFFLLFLFFSFYEKTNVPVVWLQSQTSFFASSPSAGHLFGGDRGEPWLDSSRVLWCFFAFGNDNILP